jgi:hypothetical protein
MRTYRLLGQVIRIRASISRAHSKQNQQPKPDLARGLAVDRNPGAPNALHDGAHLADPAKKNFHAQILPRARRNQQAWITQLWITLIQPKPHTLSP